MIEKLFSKYQKRTKPIGERRTTVNVTFGLEIIQLVEVVSVLFCFKFKFLY